MSCLVYSGFEKEFDSVLAEVTVENTIFGVWRRIVFTDISEERSSSSGTKIKAKQAEFDLLQVTYSVTSFWFSLFSVGYGVSIDECWDNILKQSTPASFQISNHLPYIFMIIIQALSSFCSPCSWTLKESINHSPLTRGNEPDPYWNTGHWLWNACFIHEWLDILNKDTWHHTFMGR
jgi:hypothetical protein